MSFVPWHNSASQISSEALEYPANPDGNSSMRAFLDEQAFFGIRESYRRMIYCFSSGVVAANTDPPLAAQILQSLRPDPACLFTYLDSLEEAYRDAQESWKVDPIETTRAWHAAHAQVLRGLNELFDTRSSNANPESWYTLAFCAGVLARQRGTGGARYVLQKLARLRIRVEWYLFSFVIFHAQEREWFNWETPLQRFIGGCYTEIPTLQAIMPALFEQITTNIPEGVKHDPNESLFKGAFFAGVEAARSEPEILENIIQELANAPAEDTSADRIWLIKKHAVATCDPKKAYSQLWPDALVSISERFPEIVPDPESPARAMQLWATLQAIMDAGYWAGLYVGRPEAFETSKS
ncbi:hypothetical protein G0Q06_11840 [Puniceicoccales bacterium CK1056]|uniref:Uncharacterized protein n=1 Tax=Oceanipulchritudo coccoides TaxID=2706888 RepID=A0A6B2M472_9BACT|nr:hypothetical protein [Oceanipulchritudo coccoides]NDV63146.1 hypothetical protein [Oceanipulchritudo coccoides]